MERLNDTAPAADDGQATTANRSDTASTRHEQSATGKVATDSVDSGAKFDDGERDRVVQSVSKNLLSYYFDHEKVEEASGALLTHEKHGVYDAIADGPGLVQWRLTADIRSATQDLHLEVVYSRDTIPAGPQTVSPEAFNDIGKS